MKPNTASVLADRMSASTEVVHVGTSISLRFNDMSVSRIFLAHSSAIVSSSNDTRAGSGTNDKDDGCSANDGEEEKDDVEDVEDDDDSNDDDDDDDDGDDEKDDDEDEDDDGEEDEDGDEDEDVDDDEDEDDDEDDDGEEDEDGEEEEVDMMLIEIIKVVLLTARCW
jgi:hypothetical protein